MPELPEVETIVRELNLEGLIGLKIEKIEVYWERTIFKQTILAFSKQLTGQTIKAIDRRGKYIIFILSSDKLLIHLRMTGKLFIEKNPTSHSHERLRIYLSDGRILRYVDQRKFGKWTLVDTENILNSLGIEPLSSDFTLQAFKILLHRRERQIKPFLLDQHLIAGIGNIYADEALWLAKIHPSRKTDTLEKEEISALHKAIITVLQIAIEHTGTSLGANRGNYITLKGKKGTNPLKIFGGHGKACPLCGTKIQKIKLAQRGTHFCPNCQH